ncbi:glycosyltransferase family 2 protein [Pseudomonas chlororaphis]|uniref:glycosyltransferase n=1 Tax=Pseudomonas chlororaphis TaxID=587753 RepID=UPI00209B8DDA|nr:glycosyltransferase family A protein [Pseudomonas chlororaphis]MCO7614533.1 glycosyltransferase family 2 protein [Pseudomonas chlororaphis]
MIGVVIPAHNEESFIASCLRSVIDATRHPALDEEVQVLVVLDSCTDRTSQIVGDFGVTALVVNGRNVGQARCAGARYLIDRGARWLAFTDADTVVSPEWITRQVQLEVDAVCGTVNVDSWEAHSEAVRSKYESLYTPIEGHRHIHGANLGVCSYAYLQAGGFKHLEAHEDVNLVQDLERSGARIVWTASNSVITSARKESKCREGFGDYLISLA